VRVRLALLAGLPLLWVAIAWRDVWALLLTPLTVVVTTLVLRSLARRRHNDDDEFVL
jgi:membrane protein implicated in regulation of membrane protease activity